MLGLIKYVLSPLVLIICAQIMREDRIMRMVCAYLSNRYSWISSAFTIKTFMMSAKSAESAQTSRVRILNDIADKHTLSRFKSRILDPDTQKLFVKRAKQYIDTCQVRVGEMIGSTIGSNLGEPATQAGLRLSTVEAKVACRLLID